MRRRSDRGAATVLTSAVVGLLCFATLAACGVAGLVVAHRQAQAAADLAALAAAAAIQSSADACAAAERTATGNGAALAGCDVRGEDAVVRVEVDVPGGLSRFGPVAASARAGPAS